MTYLENTTINRELVLEFFLVLSRMEFALKLVGFASGDDKKVSPDWDGFAKEVSESFDWKANKEVEVAICCYLDHPPKKQVLRNGRLDWETAIPNSDTEFERALVLVRRVRNNLFHGGKYNAQSHDETARNEELMRQGILILKAVMLQMPKVQAAYDGAAI